MKLCTILVLFLMIGQTYALEKLRLIGDFNFPTGEKFKETELGGLSGLFYDKSKNKFVAVSDDKSVINPARFYEFEFNLTEKSFSVKPSNVTLLKNKDNLTYPKHALDLEGITIIGDKLFLSSEGALNREKPILPALLQFSLTGIEQLSLPIPDKFLPSKVGVDTKYGPRDNLVFEVLASTPDGNTLFLGMEEALLQDDTVTTPFFSSRTRIIIYKDLKPTKEFLYQLDKIPSIPVAGLTVGETGLVDMAPIDENSSFTLERAYLPLAKKTVIKIFKISNINQAQDVSTIDSLKDKDFKAIDKELILNLDDILPTLSENFKSLDNIEGICIGPALSNGHKTLIVVSDNNFSKTQRTQFLAFEIIP